jgi:hypothetical protein
MSVAHEPLSGGGQQHRGVHAPFQARRRQVRCSLEIVCFEREGVRDLRYREGGVGAQAPVGLDRILIEDITEGRYLRRKVLAITGRAVRSYAGAACQLSQERDGLFVPGVLDHLHSEHLLLAHPGRFDVVGQDVNVVFCDKDAGYPGRNSAIHPRSTLLSAPPVYQAKFV